MTLVTPTARLVYSGLVPAVLAARCTMSAATIDLADLAGAARVRLVEDSVVTIDLARRRLGTQKGIELHYGVLSLGCGADAPQAESGELSVRPMDRFLVEMETALEAMCCGQRAAFLTVLGGGAAGVEIAFAAAARLENVPGRRIVLTEVGDRILPRAPARLAAAVTRELVRRGIVVATGSRASRPSEGEAVVVSAVGATAPAWFPGTGLPLDGDGFVRVDRSLRVVGHPEIFAGGDCASVEEGPGVAAALPRSGAASVAAGRVLAHNLHAARSGPHARFRRMPSRRSFLQLLSHGDGTATGWFGGLSARGRWVGRWKDHLDDAWVASLRPQLGAAPRDREL